MSRKSALSLSDSRYDKVVGTGGIGHGMFFALEGDHTLGRNETRFGKLLPYRDFCKLHIISHYLATFLGDNCRVLPVGGLGADVSGAELLRLMRESGMDTRGVRVCEDATTMTAVCFTYPDSSGGNITDSGSACARVDEDWVDTLLDEESLNVRSIVLAVPEVPLQTRLHLQKKGREAGAFTVSSFIPDEATEFLSRGGVEMSDLLAFNIDEAKALSGELDDERAVRASIKICQRSNPEIRLSITRGAAGSIGVERDREVSLPPLPAPEILASGGAGDAHLSGILLGLCAGIEYLPDESRDDFSSRKLGSAFELGVALSSLSVTSGDTIHFGANAMSLSDYVHEQGCEFSPALTPLFNQE